MDCIISLTVLLKVLAFFNDASGVSAEKCKKPEGLKNQGSVRIVSTDSHTVLVNQTGSCNCTFPVQKVFFTGGTKKV